MPKVALLSRFKAKRGKAEQLISAFRPVFEQVGKEPGTLIYVLHRSTDDTDLFWVSELYADDDAFTAHRESDAMAAATPALGELIAESELIVGEPLSAKGMPAGPAWAGWPGAGQAARPPHAEPGEQPRERGSNDQPDTEPG